MTGLQPGSASASAPANGVAGPNASSNWYVGRDGQQYGPVVDAAFRGMLDSGQILPTDLVWCDGMPGWIPASTLPRQQPQPTSETVTQPVAAPRNASDPTAQTTAQIAPAPHSQQPVHARQSPAEQNRSPAPDAQSNPTSPSGKPRNTKKSNKPAAAKTSFRYKLGTVGRGVAWTAIAVFFVATLGAAYFIISGDKSLTRMATAWIPSFGDGIETTAPISGFASTPEATDTALQRSVLWRVLKKNHPEWYTERVKEATDAARANKSPNEITTNLMQAVVKLRRQHAGDATSAPIARLKSITALFAVNLARLRKHSAEACFQYISSGESAPAIVELLQTPQHTSAIQAQLAATFEGISEGRKTPRIYPQPRQSDFDILIKMLEERGWKKAELQLFADSQKLVQAPPDVVCRLVNEWFDSQLAIKEPDVQLRLLTDSLRPIVAG
jgi:GYF domain 2